MHRGKHGLSRILIVGSTGWIGKHLAKAAVELGHQVFLLVRSSSYDDPEKAKFLESMKSSGAAILHGSLEDYASLVESVTQVDVVISALSWDQVIQQLELIKAITEAGTIKRFVPSEFGGDPDRIKGIQVLEEHRYGKKVQVRRAIEAAGIPYTYIVSNTFAGRFLCNLCQSGETKPPDRVVIYGDGNAKAIFVDETDVAKYTMRCVDDPRTLNKTLHIRPAKNILSQNEVVGFWEKKIGKELEKIYMPNAQILKNIEETPWPANISIGFNYSIFVRGDQTNFEIGPNELEATKLYPDLKYTSADSYLDRFLEGMSQV